MCRSLSLSGFWFGSGFHSCLHLGEAAVQTMLQAGGCELLTQPAAKKRVGRVPRPREHVSVVIPDHLKKRRRSGWLDFEVVVVHDDVNSASDVAEPRVDQVRQRTRLVGCF